MIVSLYIGEDKLDLFKDETIELNSSVQDVNDITKNTTDFTQSFSVPASEINNTIFKHYYDASLDNGFDARTKVNGSIKIDGITFRYGKFSLTSCKVKQGRPSSYSIIFYGNLVSLKDLLKDDELTSLDLSAYNHIYDSDNVKTGLESSLFSGSIVYPLFAKKQYYYNSLSTDNTNNSNLANIAYNGGGVNGVLWSDLRPSISLLPIIEAIETKYNITFTRDFFGREEFTKLYLWLNESSDLEIAKTSKLIDWDSGNGGDFGLSNTTDTWINTSTNTNFFQYKISVNPLAGFELVNYDIVVTNFDEEIYRKSTSGNFEDAFINTPLGDFELKFYIKSNNSIQFSSSVLLRRKSIVFPTGTFDRQSFSSFNSLIDTFDVGLNLPKIKTIDFLKGLFNMFKLVVIQDNDSDDIYVNTLKDYYATGGVYDITDYVDFNSNDVERGELLNEILYKFEDPTTILNTQFKLNVGQGYGDEELKLEDENGEPLDGGKQDYTVPFEQVVYERLVDINDSNSDTNIMYGAIVDESIEPANPKPHIHYVVNNSVGAKTMSFIDDTNSEVEINTFVNVPSHTLGFETPQYSTVFGKEINEYTREIISNTLYLNYHSEYITSIFNIKRRTFKYNAFLPLRVILKLQLNDVIQIGNTYFRINKYKYNLITGKSSFELINSFDNTINGFSASRTNIETDYTAKTESIFVTNLVNYSFIVNDLGDGTAWLNSVTNIGANVYFDIAENTTGLTRILSVTLTNDDTLQEIEIFITQYGGNLTADNNIITADSNLITADNG